MSIQLNNSEDLKKEIKGALDDTFGPLLIQMAKMIKEISESVKSQQAVNEILTAKLNLMYSLQTEMQSKLVDFDSISQQVENLDKSLAKFLQKTMQDLKNIQTQIRIRPEIETKPAEIREEVVTKPFPDRIKTAPRPLSKETILDSDRQEIKNLIIEFSKKEIYTTDALRMIEDERDRLLFDREDEVPYRAFGAKVFREVLAICKQEKDFRTISEMAAEDIRKHLSFLLEHI